MFHVKRLLIILLAVPFFSIAQIGSTTLPVKDFPALPGRDVSIDQFLELVNEYKSLSQTKKDWFYWTNYSRVNPRRFYDSIVEPMIKAFPSLKNSYSQSLKKDLYNSKSLPLVRPNNELEKVAQTFAEEMAKKKASPSHTSPSGSTFQSRMQKASIQKCAGENVSFGPDNTVLMLVLLYIDEGVPDAGHRKTLLDASFAEMAIGVGEFPDGKLFVVQDFACPQ